jgi:hypothetical protein
VLCIIIIVCISQKEWLYRAWNTLRIAIFPVTCLDQPDYVLAQRQWHFCSLHQYACHPRS